ncbi:hypothetical protein R3P38DRAFT_2768943 [Favolaschia claudopus]|uniref:Uncharacterized protein n=1 Tax=Favolaschia claudopus TaxID=2862362 RepID=A0AAW0CPZ1_9AGAR
MCGPSDRQFYSAVDRLKMNTLKVRPSETGNSERPYTEDDLTGNKKALAKFVQRQIGKWPGPKKFSESKTKVSEIREVLLSPEHGFTTNRPPVVSTHPPKQSGVPSTTKTRPEDQEETLPPPDNTSTELINLRVYIEDLRITPVQRTVAILSFGISRKEDGSVEALSKEFFAALQKSNAAIEIPSTGTGSVRLSFPDPEDEGWKVPFIRVTHGSNSVATFDPETIEITPDYRFKLYVDNRNGGKRRHASPPRQEDDEGSHRVTQVIGGGGTSKSAVAPGASLESQPSQRPPSSSDSSRGSSHT